MSEIIEKIREMVDFLKADRFDAVLLDDRTA